MKRILATAAALAAGLTTTVALAAPASAADNTTTLYSAGGTLLAKATWNDAYDTLCVRSFVPGRTMTATIELLDQAWGPVRKSDNGADSAYNCTGNLSIPEDRRVFLILGDQNRSTDDVFYS